MVKNHIELYAKEVNDLKRGDTVTITDRDGNEVTIRMKPQFDDGVERINGMSMVDGIHAMADGDFNVLTDLRRLTREHAVIPVGHVTPSDEGDSR